MKISAKIIDKLESYAKHLGNVIQPLSRFLVIVSAIIVLCMAVLIVTDIVLRLFFNHPIDGKLEFEQFMLVTLVFFTLAYTMIHDAHVSIDIISSRYTEGYREAIESVFSLLGMYLFSIICWQNIIRALTAIQEQEVALVTKIPIYPFYFVAAFGSALITLVLLINLLNYQAKLITSLPKSWLWMLLIGTIAFLIMSLPLVLKALSIEVPLSTVGILATFLLLFIMLLGFPIAFSMGLIGFLGIWYASGSTTALHVVRMAAYDSVADYFLCVIPFFVLMGFLTFRAGISKKLYNTAYKWFGQLPGGVSIATIFGCAGFAAICGDSLATAGTMGSVAIPEMKKLHYDDSLATGCVAAGGTLGILIPPSVGFIIYGLIAEQSIGKLFAAGILPGIMLTAAFSLIIYIRCKKNPLIGPPAPKASFSERVMVIKDVWPIGLLFLLVIGGIYIGLFTPTEAGGIGVVGAIIIGMAMRGFSREGFYQGLLDAIKLTSMIFAILIGVAILGYFIVITEIPIRLSALIVSLKVSRYLILAFILFLYLVLGMVMNIIPMIMVTLPIIFPTVTALGFDPIWFGVIMVIMMEMGQITPPVGINVFVIAGVVRDIPMVTIFKGILPFVFVEVIVIIILILFPIIALWAPSLMETLPAIGG